MISLAATAGDPPARIRTHASTRQQICNLSIDLQSAICAICNFMMT